MERIPGWQILFLFGISIWIMISSIFKVTHKLRSLIQPWVSHQVTSGTHIILRIQKYEHGLLDALFSGVVSVPFYTAFLPLLFWSGHGKLARQMTLLMAFCDYIGNCIKDVVSAPRPSSPPVRRVADTKDEKENALEYGFPSSHTLNTVCLSGYFLHYVLSNTQNRDTFAGVVGFATVCLLVGLIGFVTSFWAALSFLLLFAYPTPELPTPSFEYHTAFNGVALGIVTGIQQTYHRFHHENVQRIFTPELTILAFSGRILVGIPTILVVKFCSKTFAKRILPLAANALGVPVRSSGYIPALTGSPAGKKTGEGRQLGYAQKLLFFSQEESFDVDTGIRLFQHAGLAWSVVDLVPSLFSHLSL